MVGGHKSLALLVIGHQRKIDHPQEIPLVGRQTQLAALLEQRRAFEPDSSKNSTSFLPRSGGKKNDVALGRAQDPRELCFFRLAEKLYDRRLPFAALHLD